jgi:uncharacterized phage protein (TIGR02218 family)
VKFPTTTFDGITFGLLLIEPNWGDAPVRIAPRYDTIIGEGRTSQEERASERAGLYLSRIQWHLTAFDSEADDWRKGLAALGTLQVAVPLWVDALPVADWGERIFDSQKVINFNRDSGAFVIYNAGAVPAEPPHPMLAPLVLCRWQERPPAAAASSNRAEIDIDLFEDRVWAWRVGVNSYGASWGFEPDWTSPLKDASVHGLELLEINPLVAAGTDRTNTVHRWRQDAGFTFASRLEIRQALSWFVAKHGARDSWSPLPAWFQPGAATADTPANYTARFESDTLPLTFISGAVATARISFIQEVAGSVTRAPEAFLYRLSYAHDTANPELYVGGWDAPVVGAEGTFQPFQISHREIIRSLKPQDEKAVVNIQHVTGSLMADWLLGRLFGLVSLTIWKCDPANPAGRGLPLFEGYVRNVLPEGNKLTVTATLFGPLLERRIPGWVWGKDCNVACFSASCGLAEADYRSAGTISAGDLSADGMTLTVHGVTGWGAPAAANWFAHGTLRTGSGRAKQIVTIVESAAASGGNVVLKLARPIWPDLISAGQTAQLVPGCDGKKSTCQEKFDNYAHFRGCPFIPDFLATRDVQQPKPKK